MRKYTTEDHEEYRRRVDKQVKQEEEARNERAEKGATLQAWRADGGREADFERAWPQLRDEGRRRRVVDADKHAREMQRAHGPSRI